MAGGIGLHCVTVSALRVDVRCRALGRLQVHVAGDDLGPGSSEDVGNCCPVTPECGLGVARLPGPDDQRDLVFEVGVDGGVLSGGFSSETMMKLMKQVSVISPVGHFGQENIVCD